MDAERRRWLEKVTDAAKRAFADIEDDRQHDELDRSLSQLRRRLAAELESDVDERLVRALQVQLEQRDQVLRSGARRVGWKLGLGERERIEDEIAVGHLTSDTCLRGGSAYAADDSAAVLFADAEVAVRLGSDVDSRTSVAATQGAIAGYAVALEICDVKHPPDDPEAVVAGNVFHRAVAFGSFESAPPDEPTAARLIVNGRTRATGQVGFDVAERVDAAARVLAGVGERLCAGDRVITGLVVNVPVSRGDEVVADMGRLGRVALSIGA